MSRLRDDLDRWFDDAHRRADAVVPEPHLDQVGVVVRVGDGVATVAGLPDARQDELLRFGTGSYGMAVSLNRRDIGCVLLSPWQDIGAGAPVHGTGTVVRVPVGEALFGRVVDPLGRPLDGEPPPETETFAPVDGPAPAIVDRDLVSQPLLTGLTVVDALVPFGRGQRELIIGDRKTGKTALAVDTIINQRDSDVICVYAAIGQKASSVNQVISAVRRHGPIERCVFVIGEGEAPPGLQWITPYAACAVAEHFTYQGKDTLLVLDDLTKHAAVYRQLSLLLRRPPGREAYPGDIFNIHSRLLERSAKLSAELGGGSLTALPIAETQAGNLSAYIPTNLISITDGQIYLEPKLFYEGQKPAVNVGLSVSRVGGKAQPPAIRELSKRLRLDYAQFLELEVFTRFGGMVDERTRRTVEHGRRIRAVLAQPQFRPLPVSLEAALLAAVATGVLDDLDADAVERFKSHLADWLADQCADLAARIDATGTLGDDDRADLERHVGALAAAMSDG